MNPPPSVIRANGERIDEEVDLGSPGATDGLEQRANESRERLLQAVGALDKKRHALATPSLAIAAGVVSAAILGGVLVASGSAAAFAVARRRRRPFISFGRVPLQPSLLRQIAKHVGLTVVTFAIMKAGKTVVRKLISNKAQADQARRP
jgi:hypothetical protein